MGLSEPMKMRRVRGCICVAVGFLGDRLGGEREGGALDG